jgi:hypothetical protein
VQHASFKWHRERRERSFDASAVLLAPADSEVRAITEPYAERACHDVRKGDSIRVRLTGGSALDLPDRA